MTIEISDELKKKLDDVAARHALPLKELVTNVLTDYIESVDAEGITWVRATQERLSNVWPAADFSGWRRPGE